MVVADEGADAVLAAVRSGAFTGRIGDGKAWITEVERVVRFRTGEEGNDAVA